MTWTQFPTFPLYSFTTQEQFARAETCFQAVNKKRHQLPAVSYFLSKIEEGKRPTTEMDMFLMEQGFDVIQNHNPLSSIEVRCLHKRTSFPFPNPPGQNIRQLRERIAYALGLKSVDDLRAVSQGKELKDEELASSFEYVGAVLNAF